jgi:hypothetical protein
MTGPGMTRGRLVRRVDFYRARRQVGVATVPCPMWPLVRRTDGLADLSAALRFKSAWMDRCGHGMACGAISQPPQAAVKVAR